MNQLEKRIRILAAITLFIGSLLSSEIYGYSSDSSLRSPTRELLNGDQIRASDSLQVRITVQIEADQAPIRGLVITEEIPSGYTLIDSTVRLDTLSSSAISVEPIIGHAGEIHPDSFPVSWVIESKEAFNNGGTETRPFEGSRTVYIEYSIQAPDSPGIHRLKNLSAFGLLDNNEDGQADIHDTGIFSYSETESEVETLSALTPYQEWKATSGFTDDDDDSDGDGLPLMGEFYFSLDPTSFDARSLELVQDSSAQTLSIESPAGDSNSEIEMIHEQSEDLVQWTPVDLPISMDTLAARPVFLRVRFRESE